MYRLITFFAAIVSAFLLFTLLTRPSLELAKAHQKEIADYNLAIEQAQKLIDRINELNKAQNDIPPSDLERLEIMLPNDIDQVGTIITLDSLATKHGMSFGDISITPIVDTQQVVVQKNQTFADKLKIQDEATLDQQVVTIDTSEETHLRSLGISFSVTGDYAKFRDFVTEIEKNLVLMDVKEMNITEESSEQKPNTYKITAVVYQFIPGK